MLGSPESKRQYPQRLQVFFNYLKLEGDIKDQSIAFVKQYKHQDGEDLERQLIMFAGFQKERVIRKEISPSTVPNYFKAIKLFCEANRMGKNVGWKLVSKAIPRGLKTSDDRSPTLEEIQKLLEYPDRRIKPLVLTLVSSGIRIGAFETLKWKHITPMNQKDSGETIAAKILVYPGDREQYYSFVSPECYASLKDWMDYRALCGESVSKESFVMRDIWENGDIDGASNPRPLNSFAITRLLNRAWQSQKIRSHLPKGVKRHEFKTAHGFRKYFKTQSEQAGVPSIKVEMCLGHSLGVSDSYIRFTEEQMLQDYQKAIEYLTINQNVVLINRSIKKQGEYVQKSLREMEERHKTEINAVHEKYESKINELETSMQKQQSTIAEQNEKQKEASNKWLESLDTIEEKITNITKDVLDLRNHLFQSIEKSIPFIKSSEESILMIKEYIDTHPEQQKRFQELLDKHGIRLPFSD
jgi:integrase